MTHQVTVLASNGEQIEFTITAKTDTWPAKPDRSAHWCDAARDAVRRMLMLRGVRVESFSGAGEVK